MLIISHPYSAVEAKPYSLEAQTALASKLKKPSYTKYTVRRRVSQAFKVRRKIEHTNHPTNLAIRYW
jgi:hypothetical protein